MPAQHSSVGSTESLKENVKHIVEQGQERAGELRDALLGAKDKVMSSGSNFLSSARGMIADNPLAAVGIAFGVGYIAMRIFRR